MQELVPPGGVSSKVRWLIGSACAVTVLLAAYGMEAIWECVEWVDRARTGVGWGEWIPAHDAFWYRNGLALAVTAAIALSWLPTFRISRLLRVAVALPIVHLGAIIVAGYAWPVIDAELLAKIATLEWAPDYLRYIEVTLPSACMIAIAFGAMVAVAIAIKRRHGEWAHATVMLALSYLLLLGLWLPFLARFAVQRDFSTYSWERVIRTDEIAWFAVVPAACLALAFVAIVFRRPADFARWRHVVRPLTVSVFVLALLFALSLPSKCWLVYLESSYLLMTAVVLAVASLVLLTAVTWLRAVLAYRRSRGLTRVTGVVADDEQGNVALYEITSSLRGPHLVSRPFVVTTAQGNVPVSGATLIIPAPRSSTALDVGGHVDVLGPADRVEIAARTTAADGHPFRANDVADIAVVLTPDAHTFGFSDVVLVVWRPAVAYLAILLAVAAPYLTIFLTD